LNAATTAVYLTAPIAPTLARLAAPNIVAMFIMLATSAAEAWYIGQLGIEALAGLALAFPMLMLTNMLSAGSIGGAVAGAVAQRLGAGDREGAEALAFHAFLLALLMAALFSALFLVGGSAIYRALGGSGAVLDRALAYSDLLFAGCAMPWLANILSSIVRGCGQMRMAAQAMIGGSLLQICAGAALVFGVGPVPAMGMAGAALAVVIGFAFNASIQIAYLIGGNGGLTLRLRGIPIRLAHFANLLRVGLLASVSPVASVATVIAITAFAARLGVETLAGYGIGSRLEFLMIPVIFGIGAASITMIGVSFGAGDIERGHRIGWTGAAAAAAVTGSIGMILAAFPDLWAGLFTDVEAVRETCRAYLRIAGPFYAFFGLGLCLYFASQGARRVLWPVVSGLTRLALILLGGWWLAETGQLSASALFVLIGIGMLTYGLMTAAAVRLGAWRS
jgi:putative MATE family efflux protein